MEGAGGEGKERGKGGRDFTDTGSFGGGVKDCLVGVIFPELDIVSSQRA